jgi:hypothetical protein
MGYVDSLNSKQRKIGLVLPGPFLMFMEFILASGIMGLGALRNFGDLVNVDKSDANPFKRIIDLVVEFFGRIDDFRYTALIITFLFWLLVGIIGYMIYFRISSSVHAVKEIKQEENEYIHPVWFRKNYSLLDQLNQILMRTLRIIVGTSILTLIIIVLVPVASITFRDMLYGTTGNLPLSLLVLVMLIALIGRLLALTLCLLSNRIRSWYII